MNIQKNQTNSSSPKSLDDISNFFSMPLADAATNLGVCVSVLKRICRENGLDRWPYRKVLAGKSIEDIKKQAAIERRKELAEIAKAVGQSGTQLQTNESSKLQTMGSPTKLQHIGNKDVQIGRQQTVLTSGLIKGMLASDEFKFGFPSDGLLVTTNKWWEGISPEDCKDLDGERVGTTNVDDEHQSDDKAENGGASSIIGDKKESENGKMEIDMSSQGAGLLTAVRKRAVQEGREALKLGVYRTYGVNKLGRKDRALLIRIFGSSMPKLLINDSC